MQNPIIRVILTTCVACCAIDHCGAQSVPAGYSSREDYFNAVILPQAQQLVSQNLSEQVFFEGVESQRLDPNRLILQTAYSPRIYNVGGGHAGFNNGVEVFVRELSDSIYGGHRHFIFGNVKTTPPGGFVDLGYTPAGMVVDPFIATEKDENGHPEDFYYTRAELNWDGLDHVIAYIIGEEGFILMCWEDMGPSGDRDFEDVIFILDIGKTNVKQLKEPELPH